jgi:hypothetical protein
MCCAYHIPHACGPDAHRLGYLAAAHPLNFVCTRQASDVCALEGGRQILIDGGQILLVPLPSVYCTVPVFTVKICFLLFGPRGKGRYDPLTDGPTQEPLSFDRMGFIPGGCGQGTAVPETAPGECRGSRTRGWVCCRDGGGNSRRLRRQPS